MTTPPTPELDKQAGIIASGRAATVQEFIDWFAAQGLQLCAWREDLAETEPCPDRVDTTPGLTPPRWGCVDGKQARYGWTRLPDGSEYGPCDRCKGRGHVDVPLPAQFMPDARSPEQLMADHFGIDLARIDAERRAILDALRAADIKGGTSG